MPGQRDAKRKGGVISTGCIKMLTQIRGGGFNTELAAHEGAQQEAACAALTFHPIPHMGKGQPPSSCSLLAVLGIVTPSPTLKIR